ncbi:hypothetical protein [Streptomyces nojiriensis]|uniref:hypothetical protein n=2 Tax=Streptomyces nojiriensis TaxID=66374 RepID=UPI003570F25C
MEVVNSLAMSGVSMGTFSRAQPSMSEMASARSVALLPVSSARVGMLEGAATALRKKKAVVPRRMNRCWVVPTDSRAPGTPLERHAPEARPHDAARSATGESVRAVGRTSASGPPR